MLTYLFSTKLSANSGAVAGQPRTLGPGLAFAFAAALLAATACTSLHGPQPAKDASGTGPTSPATVDLTTYLTTLTQLAPGDPERQAAALASAGKRPRTTRARPH